MIKFIAMMKRKEGLSREDFVRHYEDIHAPMALRYFAGCFARYVRNHVHPTPENPEPAFDVISEFWFEDEAALGRLHQLNNTPEARMIRADELLFLDVEKTISYLVDERVSSIG